MKIKYLKKLSPNQYYNEVRNKIAIFLHHTAGGSALEAINWWEQTPERVGTSLLIDRTTPDVVWQCFEINLWAFHLGVMPGATGKITRESVGIEMVSYGWVLPEGEGKDRKFYAYPLWPSNKTKRILIPNDEVVELEKPWRGYKFWHKYTDTQVDLCVKVCRYLVDRFKIQVQKDLTNFFEYNEQVGSKDLPGIWSHSTVRKDKTDIFPQPNLISALIKEFGPKKETTTSK